MKKFTVFFVTLAMACSVLFSGCGLFGVKVDKKKISLKTDIKNFGTFDVSIKLYAGINADISVEVVEG